MMQNHPLAFCLFHTDTYDKIPISCYTFDLLLKIVGDTGENEGGDDVIKRLARFYLDNKKSK
jgi:hypothetical protein